MAAARLGDAPRARVRSARAAWNKASDRRQITAPPAMKASTLMNQDARPLQPTRSVEVPLVRRAVRVRSAASNVLDPYSVRRNVLATAREWNVVLSASAATAPLLAKAWNVATTARAPSAPGSAKVAAAVPTAVARKEAKDIALTSARAGNVVSNASAPCARPSVPETAAPTVAREATRTWALVEPSATVWNVLTAARAAAALSFAKVNVAVSAVPAVAETARPAPNSARATNAVPAVWVASVRPNAMDGSAPISVPE
mmetsp:Transcript_75768/g.167300  ORF Transcript_75768/g.167300 Transcript_75768/m.167300 type:complete len:258 (-) Transcript_75768:680-1453(-)